MLFPFYHDFSNEKEKKLISSITKVAKKINNNTLIENALT